jgi:putative toxin-antitoxin system antitoxin component (TIGR02293 family)
MTSALVEQLERQAARQTLDGVMDNFQLDNADLAAALQVDRRTIQRYRNEDTLPTRKVRERLARLREISILLEEVYRTSEGAITWLYTPVPLLEGRRPIDLMRRGKLDEVITALETYQSGAFV